MHKTVFSVVPEFLSPEQCDHICEIAELAANNSFDDGMVGSDSTGEYSDDRRCKMFWLYDSDEKYEHLEIAEDVRQIYQYVDMQFNTAKEKMGLGHWEIDDRETFQYTMYDQMGDQYNWHKDVHDEPYGEENPEWFGKTRKLSMTIFLNDFSEYEGGAFELENSYLYGPNDWCYRVAQFTPESFPELKKGSAIIFPSHLFHRVTPMISGVRKSLVSWYLGPQFS